MIFVGDRLTRSIGAGHHQYFGCTRREKQVMQWRVRQHHSEFTVVRGNAGEINFRGRNHNWSCNRHEQTRSFFRKLD